MIFQHLFASLDPRLTVGSIVAEPLVIHGIGDREGRRQMVIELAETVGLELTELDSTHTSSPAVSVNESASLASALRTRLIIADEPVSALDVSTESHPQSIG